MAAYRRVDNLRSPAGSLPVHRDQLRAQRSVSSMGKPLPLPLFTQLLTAKCIESKYYKRNLSIALMNWHVGNCTQIMQTQNKATNKRRKMHNLCDGGDNTTCDRRDQTSRLRASPSTRQTNAASIPSRTRSSPGEATTATLVGGTAKSIINTTQ